MVLQRAVREAEEKPRYRQLRMEAVPNSFGKTFAEQKALVPVYEEVPRARVVIMGMAIHLLGTGERLFQKVYLRCIDKTLDDDRVDVGSSLSGRFGIGVCWDDLCASDVGLASARNF